METGKPKEKKAKTHAIDGTREGIYGAIAVSVALKVSALPFVMAFLDPALSVPAISGGIVALLKACRNYMRKNWGWDFSGAV